MYIHSFLSRFFTCLLLGSTCQAVAVPPEPDCSDIQCLGNPVLIERNGSYMRATHAKDGSIIGVYEHSDGVHDTIRVVKSTDAGASWKKIGDVVTVDDKKQNVGNPHILGVQSGRLLVASRLHDRNTTDPRRYKYYRLAVHGSDDDGVTWKKIGIIAERVGGDFNGLWEPFLRQSRDGTLQAFYSSEIINSDQDNLMKISKDGGKSWSTETIVSGKDLNTRDGMTGVANIDNKGNVICIFESATYTVLPDKTHKNIFTIHYVLSHDDGFTWDSRGTIYQEQNFKDAGAPQIINVGGTLVASFMTNKNTQRNEDDSDVDGGEMQLTTSKDGGKNWNVIPQPVGKKGSHWPGLLGLDRSTFLGMWQQGADLQTRRFKL